MGNLRVLDAARQRFAREKQGPAPAFDAGLLSEILARPEEESFRIYDLLPSEGGMLVVAQRKTGKTTLMLNLVRCLVTGELFLGRFPVRVVSGQVAVLNYEVSGRQLGRWAHQTGIPADRLLLVNLRGRRDPLTHAEDREAFAALLREHEVESLIVDPFGRAYSGTSQNDSGEVGTWLMDLDRFARSEVGAVDLILTAHAGWFAERTRGSSALEDWADSIITMTRGNGDDAESRYLRAIGRDVSVDEDRLRYDPQTRLLSMTGTGNRRQAKRSAKASSLVGPLCEHLREHPGASSREIRLALKARAEDVVGAVQTAGRLRLVRVEENGQGKATRHWLTNPFPTEPIPDDGNGSE